MKKLPYIFLRHGFASALLIFATQFAYAGLLGDNFSFYRITFYEINGETINIRSETLNFTAGSEIPLPSGIVVYDQGIDLSPQAYPLPTGAKLQSDQYVFYNLTEDFLAVQINAQKTSLTKWSDQTIFFNNSNIFFVNFFGLPVDATAILALDIRTVSDATAVPEPHVASLILIGTLCAAAGGRLKRKASATYASLHTGSLSDTCTC
jgi:hypothetical protein